MIVQWEKAIHYFPFQPCWDHTVKKMVPGSAVLKNTGVHVFMHFESAFIYTSSKSISKKQIGKLWPAQKTLQRKLFSCQALLKKSFHRQCSNHAFIPVNMHLEAINGHRNMKHHNVIIILRTSPKKDRVSMRAVTQQFTSIRLAIDKSAREEFRNGWIK